MDHSQLRANVRQLMASGALPSMLPAAEKIAPGQGSRVTQIVVATQPRERCLACDELGPQVSYTYPGGTTNGKSARHATRVTRRPRALLMLLAAVSLAGCASASDIKPGAISGLAGQGYLKTTEGFAIVTSGCSDAQLWTVALTTARMLKPSSWQVGGPLVILSADERAGVIRAEDPRTFVGTTSYVGIFLRRLDGELRLIEVSAFWKNRMAATANPWETELLAAIRARLPCVVPSERALQSGTRP